MCTVPNSLINLILHQPVSWIGSCNLDLDPAIRGGCRRPRCTVDGDRRPQSAKGRDRRRPKAGVGECRASRARTRAEAPIQVRKGPFDPPLCVSLLVCPSAAMLLPSSAIRHARAPLRSAQAPFRLRPPSTNRNRFCPIPPTSVRYFWAQEQQPCPGASQRRSLPGNAHPASLSRSTSTSLSRPL